MVGVGVNDESCSYGFSVSSNTDIWLTAISDPNEYHRIIASGIANNIGKQMLDFV